MVVQRFAGRLEEIVQTVFALEPFSPQLVFIRAHASNVANTTSCKRHKFFRGTRRCCDLADSLSTEWYNQPTTGGRVACIKLVH